MGNGLIRYRESTNLLLEKQTATPINTTLADGEPGYNNDPSQGFGLWGGKAGINLPPSPKPLATRRCQDHGWISGWGRPSRLAEPYADSNRGDPWIANKSNPAP